MHKKRAHTQQLETAIPVPASLVLPIQKVKRKSRLVWLAGITLALIAALLLLPNDIRTFFWNGLQTHPTFTTMLLVFSLVAVSLVWSAGQRLDAWVFLTFNLRGSRPLWLDRVMVALTQIGNGFTSFGLVFIFLLLGDRILAYELILGTLTLWLTVMLVKTIVHRSRPFIRITQARIVGFRARGRSFPSGHTSQSFFIATIIVQHFHASLLVSILLYIIALLVGITRMYVGAHYPRDVLAGAILGSAWGLLGVVVEGWF